MKKKIVTLMIVAVVSASMLAGCGNTVEKVDSDNVVIADSEVDNTVADTKDTATNADSETDIDDDLSEEQEDAPVMFGTDETSDVPLNESTDEVAADDRRAQGSIGESGLPYYEIDFSPHDFTIYGFDVYCGKTAEEIYDVINLPDNGNLSISDDGWYKVFQDNSAQVVHFFQFADGVGRGFVSYQTASDGTTIYFGQSDGHSIDEADFIQSPIIPGETTLTDAIEVLGIRDLLEAVKPLEGKTFEFESQISEKSYCRFKEEDGDYGGGIDVVWIDENGKEVSLEMGCLKNVITSLRIRLY